VLFRDKKCEFHVAVMWLLSNC